MCQKLILITFYFYLCSTPTAIFGWGLESFENWPNITYPPKTQTRWIAKDIQHNGVDTRIIELTRDAPASNTLAYFEKNWRNFDAGYTIAGFKEQLFISTIVNKLFGVYQLTLELKANEKNTIALLSITRLDKARQHPASKLKIELPPGSEILARTLAKDNSVLNKTVVATHTDGPVKITAFFKSKLELNGWHESTPEKFTNGVRLLTYSRQTEEVYISVAKSEKTLITLLHLKQI